MIYLLVLTVKDGMDCKEGLNKYMAQKKAVLPRRSTGVHANDGP